MAIDEATAGSIIRNQGFSMVNVGFGGGIQRALREGGRVWSRQIQALGRIWDLNLYRGQRERANEQIAQAAQRSVRSAYVARAHNRHTPPSRAGGVNNEANRRFAGGALLRALSGPGFYQATSNTVAIINTDVLNKEARQWRRLNYGAGAAGGASGQPKRFGVVWSGLLVAAWGLPSDTRPGFRLPKGYWVAGGQKVGPGEPGTAEFFPVGEAPPGIRGPMKARATQGISAANFLDAGIERMARETPEAYQNLYREIFAGAGREGLSQVLNIQAPRPYRQNVGVFRL